jgi:hypothetical protein
MKYLGVVWTAGVYVSVYQDPGAEIGTVNVVKDDEGVPVSMSSTTDDITFYRNMLARMLKPTSEKPAIQTHEYVDVMECLDWLNKNVPAFDGEAFWDWACNLDGWTNDSFFTFLDTEEHPLLEIWKEHFPVNLYLCW